MVQMNIMQYINIKELFHGPNEGKPPSPFQWERMSVTTRHKLQHPAGTAVHCSPCKHELTP